MNDLRNFYLRKEPELKQLWDEYGEFSGPFLVSPPALYDQVDKRLMIVGQQTNGWSNITGGVDPLLDRYSEFNLGENKGGGSCRGTPFWQASHKISRSLNPDGPEDAFVWSNLVKIDHNCGRPAKELEDKVSDIGLLQEEIRILKPDVLIFFTGPSYDERLEKTFPSVQHHSLSKNITRLDHEMLPFNSFWSYHPRYLRQSKQDETIDRIISEIT